MTPATQMENPYLAARKEWQERYGSLITQARNWRVVALLAMVISLLSLGLCVYLSVRVPFKTFPVLIDSLGRTVAGGLADPLSQDEMERVRRGTISSFVSDMRTVTTDTIAAKQYVERVYARIAQGSAAQKMLNEYFRANSPFDRMRTGTVTVQVTAILPTSEHTYEAEWMETHRDQHGEFLEREKWRGSFQTATSKAATESVALLNPIGLYVTSINWTKVEDSK